MAVFADWSTPSGRETRLLMALEIGAGEWYREGQEGSLVDSANALFDDQLTADIRVDRGALGQRRSDGQPRRHWGIFRPVRGHGSPAR